MRLIIGRLNNNMNHFFWRLPEDIEKDFDATYDLDIKSGDYAIVHNKHDLDLVKILGVTDIQDKYLKHLGILDKNLKDVVMIIPRDIIRED